ncbi:hypothetical protein [Fontibacillus sp. BL9]|uniref:hypothetical protein n=1 Tax=Fontibacillus sp. BL9 TaxID=3389971 RepID=UPI00397A6C5E
MPDFFKKVTYKRVGILLLIIVALGLTAGLASNGIVKLLALIGLAGAAFIAQGSIIRDE